MPSPRHLVCISLAASVLVFSGCESPTRFDYDNPIDPVRNSEQYRPTSPINVKASETSTLDILITWEDRSIAESGYWIDRVMGTEAKVRIATLQADAETYTDPFEQRGTLPVQYFVTAFTSNSSSEEVASNIVLFQYTLSVSVDGAGAVTERVVQPKSTDFEYGTFVELTATPDEGWSFVRWLGDVQSTDSVAVVEMNSNKNVTAVFEINRYTLALIVVGEGVVTQKVLQAKASERHEMYSQRDEKGILPSSDESKTLQTSSSVGSGMTSVYNHGTVIELTATPAEGSEFKEWSGSLQGSQNPLTLTITGDVAFTARFGRINAAEPITDIDGNQYQTVRIGEQIWMASNLKTTRYRDGSEISEVKSGIQWNQLTSGARVHYLDDPSHTNTFGLLYNWYAAADQRGLCPTGWRIPDNDDWNELGGYLGGNSVAGGKLKQKGTKDSGTGLWNSPNEGATNQSGFTGLPGGQRYFYGPFFDADTKALFWSLSEYNGDRAWSRELAHNSETLIEGYSKIKRDGYSVRCIKGDDTPAKMVDIDGNEYEIVQIGTQVWMAENLKTGRYRDGSEIPNVMDAGSWSNLTTGAWSYFNNDSSNSTVYGRLYNWYAVVDTRGICPEGWNVPTDAEWTILSNNLGGESVAGGKMKATGTQYWVSPNTDATNESEFTGLPGGGRYFDGSFINQGKDAPIWSSSENNSGSAWYRSLYYVNSGLDRFSANKRDGLSVRCLRD